MTSNEPRYRVRRIPTSDLTATELSTIRALVDASFDRDNPDEQFSEDDWDHALGGIHVLLDVDGRLVSHASIVARQLHASGRALRTGYVEAVATLPAYRNRGLGSATMTATNDEIRAAYELGALGTGRISFYERLGWERWRGPTAVRTADGEERTPDEDGYVFVLRTPATPRDLDLDGRLSCEWRPGDVW
jgi:aminoglycoside 2'-N-acetyltransferase I